MAAARVPGQQEARHHERHRHAHEPPREVAAWWLRSDAAVREVITRHLLHLGVAVLVVLPPTVRERPGALRTALTSRPLVWLGEISYGVFAFHTVVLVGFSSLTGRLPFTGGFLLVLPVTLVGAIVPAW